MRDELKCERTTLYEIALAQAQTAGNRKFYRANALLRDQTATERDATGRMDRRLRRNEIVQRVEAQNKASK